MKCRELDELRLSIELRKETPLQQLDLSGLEGWSGGSCTSTHVLLTEYHNIISLEPVELCCTSLAKHEVVDYEPFKDRFQQIPPPMVKEVRVHMKEMLEMGAIHPSQSPWCNAVMLARKRDGGLCFSIDLCKLNVETKRILIHCLTYKRPLKVS